MREDDSIAVNGYHNDPRFLFLSTSMLVTGEEGPSLFVIGNVLEKRSAGIGGFDLRTVTRCLTIRSTFFEPLATHYAAIILVSSVFKLSCDGIFQPRPNGTVNRHGE